MRLSGFSQHASSEPQNCKVEPLVIPVLVITSPASSNHRSHCILGARLAVGLEGGDREECMAQDPAQHNHLLPRDFPSQLARAREERARFVSLSLSSPLLARFRGSYPCRARSPPSSAAPLAQSSPARLPVLRPPLCPPVDSWAERESRAPENSHCTPGTRSRRPDLERARHAAEHPSRIRERGGRRLELRVAGEGDHWVLSLRCPSRLLAAVLELPFPGCGGAREMISTLYCLGPGSRWRGPGK